MIALILIATPAFAQDVTVKTVQETGKMAQSLIGALQNVMPAPARDAKGDYHYKFKKIECMGDTGYAVVTDSATYSMPSMSCTYPQVRGNSAAFSITNSLAALGFNGTMGGGHVYFLVQDVDCVVHSNILVSDDRFECTITGQDLP